jgi:hypothetical protein
MEAERWSSVWKWELRTGRGVSDGAYGGDERKAHRREGRRRSPRGRIALLLGGGGGFVSDSDVYFIDGESSPSKFGPIDCLKLILAALVTALSLIVTFLFHRPMVAAE